MKVDDGGRVLALRIHDATNLELDDQPPHATQEYLLQGDDTDHHGPIFTPDRDCVAELGYLTNLNQQGSVDQLSSVLTSVQQRAGLKPGASNTADLLL